MLVSVQFLDIHDALQPCVEYIGQNFRHIVAQPIFFNCISEESLKIAASCIPETDLAILADQREEIVEKAAYYRVMDLLNRPDHELCGCKRCGKVYLSGRTIVEAGPCFFPEPMIIAGGGAPEHSPAKRWSTERYFFVKWPCYPFVSMPALFMACRGSISGGCEVCAAVE